jgi:hypothetical protein
MSKASTLMTLANDRLASMDLCPTCLAPNHHSQIPLSENDKAQTGDLIPEGMTTYYYEDDQCVSTSATSCSVLSIYPYSCTVLATEYMYPTSIACMKNVSVNAY